ncbi:hypothetical protein PYCC9005_000963 [Savitreella phatthalungensis]
MTLAHEVDHSNRPGSPYKSPNRFDVFSDENIPEHQSVLLGTPIENHQTHRRPLSGGIDKHVTASGGAIRHRLHAIKHNQARVDPRRFSFPAVGTVKPRLESPSSVRDHKKQPGTPKPALPESALFGSRPLSLWDYLRIELAATDTDEAQDFKRERVRNFLTLPLALERTLAFGFLVCLDAFLYIFTILPLRFVRSTGHLIIRVSQRRPGLTSSEKIDLLRGVLIALTCVAVQSLDTSRVYHIIRGQAAIKLYVLYNVLEIADKLLSALGQDILDCLFSKSTFGRRENGTQRHLLPAAFLVLALVYNVLHTVLLLWQLVTLNVTVNSFSNALMTLLLSNQVVEIKGSVFKKFEKEGLFQITCADMVERFQMFIMLLIIGLRNSLELVPESSIDLLQTVLGPMTMVLGSEVLVDWLKHCFITKFNHVRPAIYGRFTDVLCRDYVKTASAASNTYVDQSPAISRRIGLPVMPLVCLCIRSAVQMAGMFVDGEGASFSSLSHGMLLRLAIVILVAASIWCTLILLKLSLGISIIRFAHARYSGLARSAGEAEERRWEQDRKEKDLYQGIVEVDRDTKAILHRSQDNLLAAQPSKHRGLFGLERYSMISKRIW